MAYTKTLFTLTGLATELDRDRRTIGRALAEIPPDGKTSGYDGWYLSTALRALEAMERRQGHGGRSSYDAAVDNSPNPVDAAMLMVAAELLGRLGPIMGEAASRTALPVETTRSLVETIRAEMIAEAEAFFCRVRVPEFRHGSGRFDWRGLGVFREPDWNAIATRSRTEVRTTG
jgi:hypothetical protein